MYLGITFVVLSVRCVATYIISKFAYLGLKGLGGADENALKKALKQLSCRRKWPCFIALY